MSTFEVFVRLVAALVLAALIAACAPASSGISHSPNSLLIRELQQAREQDLSNAMDPTVGPIASGDFSVQADKAATVIDRIQHGAEVSHGEIADAMFVPPKHLSEEQRARLIQQLKQARNLDDRGWRDWTRDATYAQDFGVQERKADWVISGLERGEAVSWLDINDALQVPWDP